MNTKFFFLNHWFKKNLSEGLIGSLFALGIFMPTLFVFNALFQPGTLVYGDAPYFFSAALNEWAKESLSWISFGNNFGGINLLLWIHPLMFTYGAFHTFLGLNNDIIIRILFYFPAVLLSILGPIFFTRYLGFGRIAQFFAALVYTFNTYFLLLIDGGQVGVALSYGIFPFAFLFLKKLVDKETLANFLTATFVSFALIIADPRIALICFSTFFIWTFSEAIIYRDLKILKRLKILFLLGLVLVMLSSYWVVPTIFLSGDLNHGSSNLVALTFLNPILLFQPHWPLNEFGKISMPPFYFVAIPFLIFGILLFKRDKKILSFILSLLIITFFVKGETEPFGKLYNLLILHMPFGVAFRDSTKFFTPLLLFAGLLIGLTVEKFRSILVILVYAYLLFLIHPAILGQLNGVLKPREISQDFKVIAQKVEPSPNYKSVNNDQFLRTVWFPERSPFAYHSENRPSLDAKNLILERPFASLNVGTYDHFNFLHKKNSMELLKLLGVKYLIFSGDHRKTQLNEEEKQEWESLISLVRSTPGISEEYWGLNFPVFSIADTKPHIFGVNKLIVALGSENIYEKMSPNDYAFLFLEDGKINPKKLEKIASSSAILMLNGKEKIDLTMSFLQDFFLGVNNNESSQWATRQSEQYLSWKYELLNRGIDTNEFDFGKGIAFSDQSNEEIKFDLEVKKEGEYILAVRTMSFPKYNVLSVTFGEKEFQINHQRQNSFQWFTKSLTLSEGIHRVNFKNIDGTSVLNIVALIPKEDFQKAEDLSLIFLNKFIEKNDSIWQVVNYKQVSPVEILVTPPQSINWLVFTDRYNKGWINSYPFYSMVNGFYIEPGTKEVRIEFSGQEEVKLGMSLSAISLFVLAAFSLWVYSKKR